MKLNTIYESQTLTGYHFTTVGNANSILTNGYQHMPNDLKSYFANFDFGKIAPKLADMLSGPQVDQYWDKIDELNEASFDDVAENDLIRLESIICDLWLKKYQGGTFIWLLDQLNDEDGDDYGEACLGVTLPQGARLIHGYRSSSLYYVPARIPADHFYSFR
jgi:hypothetical protein